MTDIRSRYEQIVQYSVSNNTTISLLIDLLPKPLIDRLVELLPIAFLLTVKIPFTIYAYSRDWLTHSEIIRDYAKRNMFARIFSVTYNNRYYRDIINVAIEYDLPDVFVFVEDNMNGNFGYCRWQEIFDKNKLRWIKYLSVVNPKITDGIYIGAIFMEHVLGLVIGSRDSIMSVSIYSWLLFESAIDIKNSIMKTTIYDFIARQASSTNSAEWKTLQEYMLNNIINNS